MSDDPRSESRVRPRRNPIPNRINGVIVAAQLAAIAACFAWLRSVESGWELAALAGVFAIVMNSVYSTIHEAEHAMLFSHRRVNDGMGIALALFFPAPFHLIRQGHLGHHQRNRSDDEAFDLIFPGENPAWKCAQFYGIVTGLYWAMVALSNAVVVLMPGTLVRRNFEFDRPSAAFMESLNPRYWTWIRLEGLAAVLLHVGIVVALGVPWWSYLAMYAGFGFAWSAMQYVHHFGTERHVLRGARNLWIFAPLDWIWLHHNWHLVHHENPTVPWIHLPRLGRKKEDSRGFLPWAYLRMWRGPRRAQDRVRNRYAGRIIH